MATKRGIFSIESGSYLDPESNDDSLYLNPERRLLFALCERSIRDFLSDNPIEFEDAKQWLFNEEIFVPFSCPWVCDLLRFDQDKLLSRVTELRRVCKLRGGGTREIYEMLADFGMYAEDTKAA